MAPMRRFLETPLWAGRLPLHAPFRSLLWTWGLWDVRSKLQQQRPWTPCGAVHARASVRACAPAGPGFVCFPPNWLVFPCPAHQTACFSSHLASLPGLEPPARRRPACRPSAEEGRAAHTPGLARSGGAGRSDPSNSSPAQTPPSFLLQPLKRSKPRATLVIPLRHPVIQMSPPHTHTYTTTLHRFSPQTSSTTHCSLLQS